jgi:membrane-associated phospholipid phosphatase
VFFAGASRSPKDMAGCIMTGRTKVALVTLIIVDVALAFAAAKTPWFPGDPEIARAIQHFAPMPTPWAQTVTASAMIPWCFLLLPATIAVAWTMCGWRATTVAVAIFFGLWLLGIWLSPMVAQPRPTSELINVVGHPKGYAFPSIFGLIYGATFGYAGVLALVRLRGVARSLVCIIALFFLLAGIDARVVLGAHWPSDLLASYLLALTLIVVLLPFVRSSMDEPAGRRS